MSTEDATQVSVDDKESILNKIEEIVNLGINPETVGKLGEIVQTEGYQQLKKSVVEEKQRAHEAVLQDLPHVLELMQKHPGIFRPYAMADLQKTITEPTNLHKVGPLVSVAASMASSFTTLQNKYEQMEMQLKEYEKVPVKALSTRESRHNPDAHESNRNMLNGVFKRFQEAPLEAPVPGRVDELIRLAHQPRS